MKTAVKSGTVEQTYKSIVHMNEYIYIYVFIYIYAVFATNVYPPGN